MAPINWLLPGLLRIVDGKGILQCGMSLKNNQWVYVLEVSADIHPLKVTVFLKRELYTSVLFPHIQRLHNELEQLAIEDQGASPLARKAHDTYRISGYR